MNRDITRQLVSLDATEHSSSESMIAIYHMHPNNSVYEIVLEQLDLNLTLFTNTSLSPLVSTVVVQEKHT